MKTTALLAITLPVALASGWLTRSALESEPTASETALVEQSSPRDDSGNITETVVSQKKSLPTPLDDRVQILDRMVRGVAMEDELAALQMLQQLRGSDFGRLYEAYQPRESTYLIKAWATQDPQGLLAYIVDKPMNPGLSRQLLNQWAKAYPDAAYRAVKSVDDETKRKELLQHFTSALVSADAGRAIAMMQAGDLPATSDWAYHTAVDYLAREDPAAARAFLETLPPGKQCDLAWAGYFSSLAREHPQQAFKEASQLNNNARLSAIGGAFERWAAQDDSAALEALKALSPSDRGAVLRDHANRLPSANPAQTLALIYELVDGSLRDNATRSYVSSAMYSNPEGIMAAVENMPFGQGYNYCVSEVIDHFRQRDPERVFLWVESLPDGSERSRGLQQALLYYAQSDPDAALAHFLTMDPAHHTSSYLSNLATALASHEDGWQRIDAIENEMIRTELQLGYAQRWGVKDPAAALDYLADRGVNLDTETAKSLGGSLVEENPYQAVSWAMAIEDSNIQNEVMQRVSYNWLRQDAYAAAEYFTHMPESLGRDEALRQTAIYLGTEDPAYSFGCAAMIEDEKIRQNATINIVNANRTTPEAVKTALRQSNLPAKEINELLQNIQSQ